MQKKKIAVLPLRNTTDPSWDYLSQGFTDLIQDTLAASPILLVINQESLIVKGGSEEKDPLYYLDTLELELLITGDVSVGEEVVLHLTCWEDNGHAPVWTKTFSTPIRSVMRLGNEVSQFFQRQWNRDEASLPLNPNVPQNRSAYRTYLLANHYLNKWDRGYTELALQQYERVVELEPDFIPAYLGIAKAVVFLVGRGYRVAHENYPRVTRLMDQMLLLNPNYGELYIYKGIIDFFYRLDWEAAYRNIEEGLKNYSAGAEAYSQLSYFWYGMRRYDQALEALEAAMEYNPLSLSLLNMKGDILLSAQRYPEAIAVFQSILKLQPEDKVSYENLMYISALQKDERRTRYYLRILQSHGAVSVLDFPRLGYVYAYLRMEDKVTQSLDLLRGQEKEQRTVNHFGRLANIYAGRKDWEKVMDCLEKYFDARSGLIYMLTDPQFEPVRNWARYRRLEQQIKLPSNLLDEVKLTIQTGLKECIRLNPDRLLYAKSDEKYLTLVTYNNFRLEQKFIRLSLKALHQQLPSKDFFRCHRSYIVNRKLRYSATGNQRGYILHSLEYGFEIPVARANIAQMKECLKLV